MRAACDLAARVVGFLPLRRIDMSNNTCDQSYKSGFWKAYIDLMYLFVLKCDVRF